MKKNNKKLLCVLLTICILTTISSTAVADDLQSSKALNELETKYDLKQVNEEDVPKGVTPVEYDSIDEAKAFLQQLEDKNTSTSFTKSIAKIDTTSMVTRTVYNGTQNKKWSSYPLNYHMYVNYTYEQVSPTTPFMYMYRSFSSASSSISGITLGFSWTQNSAQGNVTNGGYSLSATVYGTLHYYLVVEGVLEVWSQPKTLSNTFWLP